MNFPDLMHLRQLEKDLWQWPKARAAVMVGAGFSLNAEPLAGVTTRFPTWRQLGPAGACEQKQTVLNYPLYNSILLLKHLGTQKTRVFRAAYSGAILGRKSTRKPISKIKARLMVCSQVFLHDETV